MKVPCTHYMGVCDHVVCPREAAKEAAHKRTAPPVKTAAKEKS